MTALLEFLEWASRGVCASPKEDPESWYPKGQSPEAPLYALSRCSVCPVLSECRAWTFKTDAQLPPGGIHGVQGGLTRALRRHIAADPLLDGLPDCVHCGVTIRPNEEDYPPEKIVRTAPRGNRTHCKYCLADCRERVRGGGECASNN